MSLLFRAADLRREIQALGILARDYLDTASQQVLAGVEEGLAGICTATSNRKYCWEVTPEFPLRTRRSEGEFMPDKLGGATVHAEITFVWELRPERTQGNTQAAKMVRLDGKASTMMRILEGGPPSSNPQDELAMWRIEVADSEAPGAYFHVQVYGRDEDDHFPKLLDVPRLPSALVSPFACVEFVLGELFQDGWKQHADRDVSEVRNWRAIQSERLLAQMAWHTKVVKEGSGSPWSAWKSAVPPDNLFAPTGSSRRR